MTPERIWAYSHYKAGPKFWRYIEAYLPVDREHHEPTTGDTEYVRADLYDRLRAENETLKARVAELEATLQSIIDLGGTMGTALYAETVDRACRRALGKDET